MFESVPSNILAALKNTREYIVSTTITPYVLQNEYISSESLWLPRYFVAMDDDSNSHARIADLTATRLKGHIRSFMLI